MSSERPSRQQRRAAERFTAADAKSRARGDGAVAHIGATPAEIAEHEATLAYLSPSERAEYDALIAEEAAVAAGARTDPLTYRDFVDRISRGRFLWYEHAQRLATVLQRVADGELKRVMVFMPPRHGKSEETSRYFPAYYLYRHPERWVGINSYVSELANTLSRSAREHYWNSQGMRVADVAAGAMKQWETGKGGGLWAAGVGGPITGKGFHLGIIDDPIKNAEEAASATKQRTHREWYQSTFYTRAEPDAAIVVIQTRWHESDLSGWLLEQERDAADDPIDGEPEHWHIVNFPAIKESDEEIARLDALDERPRWPATCTLEPDWRAPGDALCAERYPLARLRRIAKKIGTYFWNALFQQRPRPAEGNLFRLEWLPVVDDFPRLGAVYVAYFDFAATKDGGDFTAGALLAKVRDTFYIVDVMHGQWAPGKRDHEIRETAERWALLYADEAAGVDITFWIPQDPGAAGVDARILMRRVLAGFDVHHEPVQHDKLTRARPLASSASGENVKLVRGIWNATVRRELLDFPRGRHDDIVDAISGAYAKLARERSPYSGHSYTRATA